MSTTKHTPGPWKIWQDMDTGEPLMVQGMETDFICEMVMYNTEAQANAQLIAAAPDLLEFAEACANDSDDRISPGLQTMAFKVIAKATGKTNH